MAEYGSVRQYRNRVTRMWSRLEQSPLAVSCQRCIGGLPCGPCMVVLDTEWEPNLAVLFPPALQGTPAGTTGDLGKLVR